MSLRLVEAMISWLLGSDALEGRNKSEDSVDVSWKLPLSRKAALEQI